MTLPDFTIPIEDEHAARFWLEEWDDRFRQTNDHAFKEAADAMRLYIAYHLEDDLKTGISDYDYETEGLGGT